MRYKGLIVLVLTGMVVKRTNHKLRAMSKENLRIGADLTGVNPHNLGEGQTTQAENDATAAEIEMRCPDTEAGERGRDRDLGQKSATAAPALIDEVVLQCHMPVVGHTVQTLGPG